MEVPNEIIYNFVLDLKKKELDPIDKARIIHKYCELNNISIKQLATDMNIAATMLQEWMDYAKLDKQHYLKLVSSGYSRRNIYRMLKGADKMQYSDISLLELNVLLKNTHMDIKNHVNNPIYDDDTIPILKELINDLNRLEFHIEQKMKKGGAK